MLSVLSMLRLLGVLSMLSMLGMLGMLRLLGMLGMLSQLPVPRLRSILVDGVEVLVGRSRIHVLALQRHLLGGHVTGSHEGS